MPRFDWPLDELVTYDPATTAQPDFDAYWERTLAEGQQAPLNLEMERIDYPALGVDVFEVYYDGWRGARICGWLLLPQGRPSGCPALVNYHGYSGSKAEVYHYLMWALQGYVVLAVDTRGQSGNSSDPGHYTGGHVTGWMTKGVMNPEEYYYRGAYMDCVRALDVVCALDQVDPARIGITGMSQGGGLTLAVAALDSRPILAMPEMPYLCHFKRALDMAVRYPYGEIAAYLRKWPSREAQVWRTLSYCDNLNLASRITCPVLMTVGLEDDICPPSSIYAVYNKITAHKTMCVYPYHNHSMVEAHWETKLRWAHERLMP